MNPQTAPTAPIVLSLALAAAGLAGTAPAAAGGERWLGVAIARAGAEPPNHRSARRQYEDETGFGYGYERRQRTERRDDAGTADKRDRRERSERFGRGDRGEKTERGERSGRGRRD